MKLNLIAVASTIFALSLSAHAEDMPGMKMDDMESMQMEQKHNRLKSQTPRERSRLSILRSIR